MSVLINDMEMPETCDHCPFHIYHSQGEYVCKATSMLYPMNLANSKGIRKDWCPLTEAPESYEDKLKEIADALLEKMSYMNTCPNERDIILSYLGHKRSSENHCNTDCWNGKCESYNCETKQQPEQRSFSCGQENDLISRQAAIDVVHKIIYGFLDLVDDDSEEPISDKDKLLLEVNKAICNGIKYLVSAQPEREGRKDDEQIRGFGL